jgi:hypothetical protein
MDSKTYQHAVIGIERLLADHKLSREEILCVLARVTANAIHVIEERPLRIWAELEYIKALGRFSAEEENKQLILQNETPKHHDHFVAKMLRGVHACLAVNWDT